MDAGSLLRGASGVTPLTGLRKKAKKSAGGASEKSARRHDLERRFARSGRVSPTSSYSRKVLSALSTGSGLIISKCLETHLRTTGRTLEEGPASGFVSAPIVHKEGFGPSLLSGLIEGGSREKSVATHCLRRRVGASPRIVFDQCPRMPLFIPSTGRFLRATAART